MVVVGLALLGPGCHAANGARPNTRPATVVSSGGGPGPTNPAGTTVTGPVASGPAASTPAPATTDTQKLSDQEWARRALQVLDSVDAAVADYHAATGLPRFTLRYRQLQESAFAGFNRALTENQAFWPATQRVGDTTARDQYVFVMGNVGGFLHPTPDLPGDPLGPTLGDRIGRSLQNAVSGSASLRPRLLRLAAGK